MLGEWKGDKYYVEGMEYKFPDRPPLNSMRNYGLPKNKQVWKRREEYLDLDWEDGWERKPGNLKYLEEELLRIYDGEWVIIGGNPVYINGMFYFFLQWYMLPDSGEYPEYRDTSLYYYRFLEIVVNTRLCTGHTLMKGRRLGATSMVISYLLRKMLLVERKTFGITSKSAADADSEGAFGFLTSAFEALPVFLKPEIPDKETPKKVLYFKKKAVKGKSKGIDTGLNNRAFWRAPGMNTFDSGAFEDILLDETGKYDKQKTKVNIIDYLPIVTKCVKKGAKVTGKLHLPTTVNPPEDGGANYKQVWADANQFEADYLGQTKNGLYRIMIPAYYGFAGYIDQFGNSVAENPTPEQTKYLESTGECPDPKIGAKQYLENERKKLENDPDKLQAEIQMNPFNAEEVFESSNSKCAFNVFNLNERIKVLEEKMIQQGLNLKFGELGRRGWFHELPNKKVTFVDDPEGLWYVHALLPESEANKFKEDDFGRMFPQNLSYGAAGLDPIWPGITTVDEGSNACCIIRRRYTSMDEDNSGIPVAMYHGRPEDPDKFHEQIFNGLIYYGIQMLGEKTPSNWIDYAHRKKLTGYLIGKVKSNGIKEYGSPNNGPDRINEHLQEQQMSSLMDHDKVPFVGLLRERLLFDISKRTKYDRCMADGYACVALKEPFEVIKRSNTGRKFIRTGKLIKR